MMIDSKVKSHLVDFFVMAVNGIDILMDAFDVPYFNGAVEGRSDELAGPSWCVVQLERNNPSEVGVENVYEASMG